jgi:hypothetical protein
VAAYPDPGAVNCRAAMASEGSPEAREWRQGL